MSHPRGQSAPADGGHSNAITDVIAAAVGAERRQDEPTARTGGTAGNARLTAWTGLVLLVLFVVETATLLSLGRFIGWHIAIGVVLVPIALLKTATTGWRIVRYYSGHPAYTRAGPPPLLLRLLGPVVVVAALAVLGSGLALLALGDASHDRLLSVGGMGIDAVTVHKATFVLWLAVVGLHVLTRLVPALQLTVAHSASGPVGGGRTRLALVAASIAVGVVAAVVIDSHLGTTWTRGRPDG